LEANSGLAASIGGGGGGRGCESMPARKPGGRGKEVHAEKRGGGSTMFPTFFQNEQEGVRDLEPKGSYQK